ncbi:MAG: hypothetical protein MZV64_52485 [Ignavibacteriales bacterium]|nr:hypothetical protein [Ignavibacteriales bacterium]
MSYQKRNFITIKVYDILGNEIATLVNEEKPAGNFEVEFTAEGLIKWNLFLFTFHRQLFIHKKDDPPPLKLRRTRFCLNK